MALGTPVLVSTDLAIGEVAGFLIEKTAILVDPLDVGAIAVGLSRLVADDVPCITLSRRGPERATLSSPARYAERVDALYRSLLPKTA